MKTATVIILAIIAFILIGCGEGEKMQTAILVLSSATPVPASPTDTLAPSLPLPTLTATPLPPTPTSTPTSPPPIDTPSRPVVILDLSEDSWRMTQFQTSDQIANIGPNRETLSAGTNQTFITLSFESLTGKSLFDVFVASGSDFSQVYIIASNGRKYVAINMGDLLQIPLKTTSVTFEAMPEDQMDNLEFHFLSAGPFQLAGGIESQPDFPTAEPPSSAPTGEPYLIYTFCNCQENVPAGGVPTLRWAWVATTQEQTQDFITSSKSIVTIDGKEYKDLERFWGEITFSTEDNGYKSVWAYPLPILSPGTHRIEYNLSLNKAVTDGYDSNNDGQVDQYGPGDTFYGWVDVVITSAATTCPNGAPAGHWLLIANKSSSGDSTITIDGVKQPVKSGRNEFFLIVDQSHTILVGTTTMNFSAPECGENTVVLP